MDLISPEGRCFAGKTIAGIRAAREAGRIDGRWEVRCDGTDHPIDSFLVDHPAPMAPLEAADRFLVDDYRQSLTASGRTKRSFRCPQCDRPLISQEEQTDACPNCGAVIEFATSRNSLGDARQRVKSAQQTAFWTPLRKWILVVIGVHALVGVLIGQTVVEAVLSDRSAISLILVLCYLVALARSFADVRYVSQQTLKARRQVLTLVEGGRIRTLLEQCEDSLMRDHITNLYEISKRSTEVSQDNLVVLMQSKLHARIRLTEIAGGVLVTIGLVGTIVGLISSFAGIDLVLQHVGQDRDQLLAGFTDTLGGMGTAFYTTLLGSILGGVVMRVLNTIVVSSTDALISHIAELTEVYILPTIRTSAQRRGTR